MRRRRARSGAAVAAAVTGLLAALAASVGLALALAPAALAHAAGPLAFVQAGMLRIAYLDDGHVATIARGVGGDAAIAPDGKQVAYIAKDGSLHLVGIAGRGDRRVAKGPLGSPLWRSATELGATRPAGGSLVDAIAIAVASGKERTIARQVASQVFPIGADLVAKPAPGCATTDLYLGRKRLTRTPVASELPLAASAELGIIAVVRTQPSSFQCAPASVPVPTELRAYDTTGSSRLLVGLGKLPANRPLDAALSPQGAEFAYVTAKGDLAIRSFLTRRDRIVARGSVTAVGW